MPKRIRKDEFATSNTKSLNHIKELPQNLINLSEGNKEEQSKVIRKQEALIDEMKRYIENKEDFKNSLGQN